MTKTNGVRKNINSSKCSNKIQVRTLY